MIKALTNATIFTGSEVINDKALLINDGKVLTFVKNSEVPPDCDIMDCKRNFISPGMIDLQIAGGGGYLFSSNLTGEAIKAITRAIKLTGTTGFLITLPTNTPEVYRNAIKVVKENPDPALIGLHLEGPYISPVRKGAHVKNYIKIPVLKDVKDLIEESEGVVKMLTIAPEVCDPEIIEYLNNKGVVVAAGHSNATFTEAKNGFRNGVKTTTHLFNAMSQMHHRDPGLPGAVFITDGVKASIIADGIHVDFSMVTIAKKLLGERLFLITDAVEENLKGDYLHVRQSDRFTLPDGTLSGSLLTMLKAVKNCVEVVGIPVDESLRMASAYPAALMGLNDRGSLTPGKRADIVVFDKDFKLIKVFQD